MLPPPPLSLSAPELSAEPPPLPLLKRSVSSTELLYEKAMARFYKAMELDEREQLKRKSKCASAEALQAQPLPSPSLPSKRDSIGNSIERGLERKSSLRRRLSGEIPDVNINFAGMKSPSIDRLPSPKRSLYPQESLDDPDYLSHVDEDYTDDYTESTASSGESETEKFKRRVREHGQQQHKRSITQEELDTYHPRNRMTSPYTSPDSDQAVEVLSKPYALPNPDFIPKPILKRPSSVEGDSDGKRSKPKSSKTKSQRNTFSKLFERKGSSAGETEEKAAIEKKLEEEASQPLTPAATNTQVNMDPVQDRRDSTQSDREKKNKLKMEMRQSSIEEQKVAIDHYSDLVREKANWRTAAVPLYLNADDLKKAAGETVVDELEDLNFELQHTVQAPPRDDDSPLMSPSHRVIVQSLSSNVMPESNPVTKQLSRESVQESDNKPRNSRPKDPNSGGSERSSSTAARPGGASRNTSAVRRTGKTPVEARMASKTRERSVSKSPLTVNRRPLAMARDESQGRRGSAAAASRRTPSVSRPMTPEEELQQQQDIDTKVKSTMSYATDVVLFVVACWVYLFKDARLALPIVLLLVYRHIREHLPLVRKAD